MHPNNSISTVSSASGSIPDFNSSSDNGSSNLPNSSTNSTNSHSIPSSLSSNIYAKYHQNLFQHAAAAASSMIAPVHVENLISQPTTLSLQNPSSFNPLTFKCSQMSSSTSDQYILHQTSSPISQLHSSFNSGVSLIPAMHPYNQLVNSLSHSTNNSISNDPTKCRPFSSILYGNHNGDCDHSPFQIAPYPINSYQWPANLTRSFADASTYSGYQSTVYYN